MKKTSILQQLIIIAIYITLGVPLVITSIDSPSIIEPHANLKVDDFLKSDNGICVSGSTITYLKNNTSEQGFISAVKKDDKLARSINSLKMCSLVIGIILLSFAFINIASLIVKRR